MEYQFYQLLLFFSIYCLISWGISVSFFALTEGFYDNRGIVRGPIFLSGGLGAMILVVGQQYMLKNVDIMFAGGYLAATYGLAVLTALILGILGMVFVNCLCGQKLVQLRWYQPFLWGFGGLILVYHLHPLIEVVTNWISPWVHLAFLLVFWLEFVPGLVDGIAGLSDYKRKTHFS